MKIVINPQYKFLKDFVESLPEKFVHSGKYIYQERNEIKEFFVEDNYLVVKSFKIPHFVNKLVYTNFRLSKARRSYENALILQEKKIGTPAAIAYVENKRGGLLFESYFVSFYQKHEGTMREFRYGILNGRENLLCSFARFTAFVHNQEVLHKDYSPGNVLYTNDNGTYSFSLIDINRVKFGFVSMEEGCKNFRRLWGNREMIEFIAREYALSRGFDANVCIKATLKYHHEFWEKYGRRHNGLQPHEG